MADLNRRPKVLLFDVNETLLDLTPLKKSINVLLLDERADKLWFTSMLQHSLVMTVSEQHAAFPDIGAAVLQMLARNADIVITPEEAKNALAPMRSLPPFPDVRAGLERLKKDGIRLATLTNSSQSGVQAQIQHAGLADCFERLLSVEGVGKYKPHQSVYLWATQEMKCEPEECMLVAAHGWDVAGAKWAGLRTSFIARPGQQLFPLGPEPDIQCTEITALADQLCG